MKSVLISIKPQWCELIASGKKTIEVRKTKPQIATPFKVYIYCTSVKSMPLDEYVKIHRATGGKIDDWHGKVIGEFVCGNIDNHTLSDLIVKEDAEHTLSGTCLTKEEVLNYLGYQKGTSIYACKNYDFYGWHISNLVIYDKPKELSEFRKPCIYGEESDVSCFSCDKSGYRPDMHIDCFNMVTRPPQSWCYVESEVME